jgi:hypothetical protein
MGLSYRDGPRDLIYPFGEWRIEMKLERCMTEIERSTTPKITARYRRKDGTEIVLTEEELLSNDWAISVEVDDPEFAAVVKSLHTMLTDKGLN